MPSVFDRFRSSPHTKTTVTLRSGDQQTSWDSASIEADVSKVATGAQPLTIIELFQSQGCNSCPPANSNLINIASSTNLLLTYHVTYWDYLGWPDTFALASFDQRQRDYVRRLGLRSAFTPQVIVNGRASGVGSSKSDLNRLLTEGGAGHELPVRLSVLRESGRADAVLSVDAHGAASGHGADILLVWYEPRLMNVHIGRGENSGKTLPHQNVVREVQRIGRVHGSDERTFEISLRKNGLKGVVLVQDGAGGKILGAVSI